MTNKGWTDEMRRNHYPRYFNKRGDYIGNEYRVETKTPISDDTVNRKKVIEEIEQRCKNGEDLDKVTEEIASRPEIQEQFAYFAKNGIKRPLSEIFKSWYNGRKQSIEKGLNRW